MPAPHREHVGVAAEVGADRHVTTLCGCGAAVKEDSLRARVAPPADHVPQGAAGSDHRGGIAEDVAVASPSDADLDRHDALPGWVDGERGRREADEVVDAAGKVSSTRWVRDTKDAASDGAASAPTATSPTTAVRMMRRIFTWVVLLRS